MKIKFIIIFIFFYFTSFASSIENKILFKINNEIITTLDIFNESKYLKSLNVEVKNLDDNQIFEIAKRSLIRNKIKKIEIINSDINYNIDEMFTDKLVERNFSKLGINNIKQLTVYIESFNLNIEEIKEKILIDALWNNLIFNKYSNKIKIDKNELEKEIIKNKSKLKSYLLYEILFNIDNKNELQEKYETIKKTINDSNFQNAALKYSISESSKLGGKLGWIQENSINKNLRDKISKLNINEYSEPIFTAAGFLILMVKDKKETDNNINLKEELNKLIQIKTNQQFEQYSNIYFNKISKNYIINEL